MKMILLIILLLMCNIINSNDNSNVWNGQYY